eukprot:CAMPEP_0196762222 /NCGR_PEP_ID=MMETSP1095-20130614/1624_1 /TAXON_ID=96789 ORGANISM="Chromulina nebulosa, Strain UTEXLB2642" /NCGR_SAMPLE_ID=MMETSP1095 /ASSEMBLY_ACC=CAM_ASM_000446 /LENGTH=363 /DNA_ID=CAMNT_0042112749 /DNA_START=519 /DNA_END=1610 /DNA_ORIENTATION=+
MTGKSSDPNNWLEPQLVSDLTGEEVTSISVGLSHTIAVGRGGDCFLWGENDTGQLGLGDFNSHHTVAINNSFPAIKQVSCGANHSVVLTRSGQVYSWGHASNGRLGIGASERLGVSDSEKNYFPIPQLIKVLEPIRQISCGADHCLAYGPSGAWSWGSGSGGKLGFGDTKDRYDPVLIPKLKGKFILEVSASTWFSAALVCYPPMTGGGWLLTWGSGYHGQLAQNQRQVIMIPEVVEYFQTVQLILKSIFTGPFHCAAITTEGELYTWGSNINGCLGRRIDEKDVQFTNKPGVVSGFGAIVNRIGRGLPKHVACGKEFTVVCTYPYSGPSFVIAAKLMEEAKIREQETLLARKAEQQINEDMS